MDWRVLVAALLQGHSRIKDMKIDLNKIDYDVDVLVIGGAAWAASLRVRIWPEYPERYLSEIIWRLCSDSSQIN